MISRIAPVLVLLAACGAGGVCAGCGGDDGDDVPPARVSFTATWESSTAPPPAHCSGDPSVSLVVSGFDTTSPALGTYPCQQAVDDGDHWTVTCPRDQALNRGGVDVHLDKGLEAGDVVLTAADGSCSDTFRMTSITVE